MSDPYKILFASRHFYLDQSKGASISTRSLLQELAKRRWNVKTFCGFQQDYIRPTTIETELAKHELQLQRTWGNNEGRLVSFKDYGISSLAFITPSDSFEANAPSGSYYLQMFKCVCEQFRPDVLVTYGGTSIGYELLRLAQAFDIKTVVTLHNVAYWDPAYFEYANLVLVPSLYAQDVYKKRLGIDSVAILPLLARKKISCDTLDFPHRNYVLFVNPSIGKGLGVFARVVKEIWRIRPEIKFLVMEGSCDAKYCASMVGDFLKVVDNVEFIRNTPFPELWFQFARLTIYPSLYPETYGRSVAESMMAGTPVVASTRGALPEVVQDAGPLLPICDRLTPVKFIIPEKEEVWPWIETILRIFDDQEYYLNLKHRGLLRASEWNMEDIVDKYEERLKFLLK